MKKYLFLFIVMTIFGCYNVQALGGTYTKDDFSYTISKIHLDVYKSNIENGKFNGYDPTLLYQIDLPQDYTINPQYYIKNSVQGDPDSYYFDKVDYYVSLHLNATKENIKSLLDTKIATVDENNHYFIRMMVDYTMNAVPGGEATNKYKVTYNSSTNAPYNDDNMTLTELALNTPYSEVFSNFEYKLIEGTADINYETTYGTTSTFYTDFYRNNSIFYDVADQKITNEVTLSFVGYDDIKPYLNVMSPVYVIETTGAPIINSASAGSSEVHVPSTLSGNYALPNSTNDNTPNKNEVKDNTTTDQTKNSDQVVQVPNTISRLNITLYLVGVAFVVVGSMLLTYVLRKKIKKVEEN